MTVAGRLPGGTREANDSNHASVLDPVVPHEVTIVDPWRAGKRRQIRPVHSPAHGGDTWVYPAIALEKGQTALRYISSTTHFGRINAGMPLSCLLLVSAVLVVGPRIHRLRTTSGPSQRGRFA